MLPSTELIGQEHLFLESISRPVCLVISEVSVVLGRSQPALWSITSCLSFVVLYRSSHKNSLCFWLSMFIIFSQNSSESASADSLNVAGGDGIWEAKG